MLFKYPVLISNLGKYFEISFSHPILRELHLRFPVPVQNCGKAIWVFLFISLSIGTQVYVPCSRPKLPKAVFAHVWGKAWIGLHLAEDGAGSSRLNTSAWHSSCSAWRRVFRWIGCRRPLSKEAKSSSSNQSGLVRSLA